MDLQFTQATAQFLLRMFQGGAKERIEMVVQLAVSEASKMATIVQPLQLSQQHPALLRNKCVCEENPGGISVLAINLAASKPPE
ncbi:hypothetical protein AB1Y20_008522 [Prymnesium parvum]|uniref:Uncharacterized protein n=1 Tax=Prymnesium parvum TaxID=97485 RepID=A0AB34IUS1_PRYPA